jgi:hypothetical protein
VPNSLTNGSISPSLSLSLSNSKSLPTCSFLHQRYADLRSWVPCKTLLLTSSIKQFQSTLVFHRRIFTF